MWGVRKRDDALLEECLGRLARGETVAQCLERYPDRAAELRPSLEAAQRLMGQSRRVGMTPEEGFRLGARRRLLQAFAEQRGQGRRPWLAALPPRLVAVGAAFALVIGLGLGTTYRAAAESIPGEPLYWLKDKTEQVRLALPRSQESQAHFQVELAEKRAKEGTALLRKGAPQQLPKAEERFRLQVQQALKTAQVDGGGAKRGATLSPFRQQQLRQALSQRLRQQAQREAAEVQRMLQTAPPEMRPHLRQLLATLEEEYGQALRMLEATPSPSRR